MKIEEVPQDLKYCEGAVVRDQNYAVDEEGRYHMVKSDGWAPKNDALDLALEEDKDKEERSRMAMRTSTDFQGFELPLSHRPSAHCENGAISTLLRYYGIELSEPMIFGLASGLFFVHLPFIKMSGIPYLPRSVVQTHHKTPWYQDRDSSVSESETSHEGP